MLGSRRQIPIRAQLHSKQNRNKQCTINNLSRQAVPNQCAFKKLSNSLRPKPSKCKILGNLKHLRRLSPWYVSRRITTF